MAHAFRKTTQDCNLLKEFLLKILVSVKGMWDEKYPHQNPEKALKDCFGKTIMSQLLRPTLINAYDIKNANPIDRRRCTFLSSGQVKGTEIPFSEAAECM